MKLRVGDLLLPSFLSFVLASYAQTGTIFASAPILSLRKAVFSLSLFEVAMFSISEIVICQCLQVKRVSFFSGRRDFHALTNSRK
jgi:hypothetical protein